MGPQAQFSPPSDDPLRKATPTVDDVEARRARAAIEGRLFAGRPQRVKVGRYHVQGRIGSGGMGVVYRAHDPELARDVAVKLMNPEGLGESEAERARGRLVREARAMARLAHPNVIHVYDVGTIEDGVFIAMELVDGQPLSKWLTSKQRAWREILERFCDAGRGLAAAHAAGVVHRDFKPENVLLGLDGRVRVGDFGLAGAPSGDSGPADFHPSDSARGEVDRSAVDIPLTRTGAFLGTPKYMAPEQEMGEPADARSDQFSFCVALYEGLYGRPPYEGQTVAVYRQNVQSGTVLDPPLGTQVPPAVHAELLRGLATDPEERHDDMGALLERLEGASDPRPKWSVRWGLLVGAPLVAVGGLVAALMASQTPEETQQQPLAAATQGPTPPAVGGTSTPPAGQDGPGSETAAAERVGAADGEAGGTPEATEPIARDAKDEAEADGDGDGDGDGDARDDPGQVPNKDAEAVHAAEELEREARKPTRTPPKRRRRGRDHCYSTEDKNKFLTRRRASHEVLRHGKRCYACLDASPHQVSGLAATDDKECTSWHICRPVSDDQCSE